MIRGSVSRRYRFRDSGLGDHCDAASVLSGEPRKSTSLLYGSMCRCIVYTLAVKLHTVEVHRSFVASPFSQSASNHRILHLGWIVQRSPEIVEPPHVLYMCMTTWAVRVQIHFCIGICVHHSARYCGGAGYGLLGLLLTSTSHTFTRTLHPALS